jgi:fructose-bisphosphate aldolase class II
MPLVHMNDMLNHAYRHGYAVGAFAVVSLDFLEGIMDAAEESRSPVILNLTESHFDYYDFDLLAPAVLAAAKRARVPVAIHLDHGKSPDSAERAIQAGCSGVMVDASHLPFDQNLQFTRQTTALAHACGVAVEGELGYVAGGKGENAEKHGGELAYTSPAEAKAFVDRTEVDCLAVSVGTVHGRMAGSVKLDFARLGKINETLAIPLVIHGGSGLADDQYRKLIAHGVAKINCYTALSDAAVKVIRENAATSGYMALNRGVRSAVRQEVERCIRLWGGSGRAAEVLAQCQVPKEVDHLILYDTPADLSDESLAVMVRRGKDKLRAIPGVRHIFPGKALQNEGRYQHCWLVRFTSQAVAEHYRSHPAYGEFFDKLLRPSAKDLAVFNFEERD